MENVRIAILNSENKVVAYMDNTAPNAMHYYDDELHTYLQGSAYTFKFETGTLNTEAEYLAVGNHLAFQHADKDYYLNIMHVEKTEYTASVEAYGLLFELLNEEKDAYKASKAMSFIEYMKIFDSAGSVKIGINEISTYSRMIEWTASEEMLARIYSLATNFDAGAAGKDGQMLYATCDTAAGTVAKVATLASGTLSLKAGATVAVKFTYANTASSPTLNIAGTGAKAMYIQGVRDVYWTDGATVTFTYDGANWRVASEPVYAPTATIGNAAGFHVFIDGTSVQVRKGSEELAIFKGDEIRLGEGADCAKVFIGDLEIGVDGAETYLRNSSTRISTKSSHEGGSASVPSLVVDDKDTWINGRGMSSLVNFFPGNVHRMTAGTKVLTAGKTGTSRQLFSNSEINSLLGVSNSSNGNTAVMVSNGDGAATGVHVEGCTYQNGAWHTVFNTNIGSVPIRINYIITYWG